MHCDYINALIEKKNVFLYKKSNRNNITYLLVINFSIAGENDHFTPYENLR